MDQGGSIRAGSQIFPEFVQVKKVIFNYFKILNILINFKEFLNLGTAFVQYAG